MENKLKNGPGEKKVAEADCYSAFLEKLKRTSQAENRLFILKTCAKLGRPWVEKLLWKSLADPCESVRDFLIRELSGRKEVRRAQAVEMLSGPPWYARCAVLKIAGKRKMAEIIPYIACFVHDPNLEIKRSMAETLGKIGGSEGLRLLVKLRQDASPYVRAAAEKAITEVSGLRFT